MGHGANRGAAPAVSPVRKGRMWRVQIMRSNCSVRYFGRFSSEKRAREWIAAHVCLTKQVIRK
jgi:hypothetical protein